jgi:hypothetical protein
MQPLSASDLLNAWERGLAQAPAQRALSLLAAAHPRMSVEDLAELSVGQRDARLLTLREWTFGSQLASLADCPSCGERLEMSFNVSDVRAASETELTAPLSLDVAGYEVRFRLPNSLDLIAIATDNDVTAARQRLLGRCLLAAHQARTAVTIEQLPAEVTAAIAERMGQADPQTDVQLALTCPACGHQWQATFDIMSFFWSEIHAWADRILREVHTLASFYGWSEADILALSPRRRQRYLEMVRRS